MNMKAWAIHTEALTKSYGDRPALQPTTLEVRGGERLALVGHNGSGKTTLMRLLAGLMDPSDGSAEIYGHASGSSEARRQVSWLSDTPTFYDDLSLIEHLEYVARLHGVAEWQPRAEELIAAVGLTARATDLPTTFSRGLRQKAAICLALVRPFGVLLVDEPFVGLDQAGKEVFLELIRAIDPQRTVMIATHELGFVDQVGRIVALHDGAVSYDGTPGGADVAALVRG